MMSEEGDQAEQDPRHRRRQQRKEIPVDIDVFDGLSGTHIGLLVNITVEGIMIIADREIRNDCIFQYELRLPMDVNGSNKIIVGVDCLWCQPADQLNRFWAGYHIIDISEADLKNLEVLIDDHGQASLL